MTFVIINTEWNGIKMRKEQETLCFLNAAIKYAEQGKLPQSPFLLEKGEIVTRIEVRCGKGDPVWEIRKLPRKFGEITFAGEEWTPYLKTSKGKILFYCRENKKWVQKAA